MTLLQKHNMSGLGKQSVSAMGEHFQDQGVDVEMRPLTLEIREVAMDVDVDEGA